MDKDQSITEISSKCAKQHDNFKDQSKCDKKYMTPIFAHTGAYYKCKTKHCNPTKNSTSTKKSTKKSTK
jgi:hypothetical protein